MIPAQRRRRIWLALTALGTVVAVAAAAPPATRPASTRPASVAPRHRSFLTLVNQHWTDWDQNGDGVLSADEINRAIRDPSLHGSDAAAAAALKLLSQNSKLPAPLPPLTRAYFAEYDRQLQEYRRHAPAAATQPLSAEAATIDTVSTGATTRPAAAARPTADWELYLAASRERIARGGHDVWPGRFILDHLRQGPLGDCYFVAGVGDVVAHDPSRVGKWVTPLGDGRFRVRFATGPEVVVGPLTDAELALSSTTAGDGAWMALLEEALAHGRGLQQSGNADVEAVDEIGSGGAPARRSRC